MIRRQAAEKVVQKMTKDGLVEENKVTGEVRPATERKPEPRLNARLEISEEDRADAKLRKQVRRVDRAADRLEQAQAAIPKKKVLRKKRVYQEASGKYRTKLCFETEDQEPPQTKLRFHPLSVPARKAAGMVHGEIRKAEQENVGVEAGHKGELLAESGLRFAGQQTQKLRQEARMKPWKELSQAEKAVKRANADYLYHKTIQDNPGTAANPVSRYLQKRRIKKDYAKRLRQQEQAAASTKRTAQQTAEAVKAAVLYVKKHSKAVLVVLGLAASITLLLGGLSSCTMMVGSGISGMFAATYTAEDPAMLGAEAAYCAMEADLQAEIDAIETTYPGYAKYNYDLDEIGHDPYVLISMLSALHDGVFTMEDVQEDLERIFSNQYTLTLTAQTEWITEDGVSCRGQVLHVELENIGMDWLPSELLTEEQLASYAAYMSTLGNREDLFAGVPGASTLKEPTYYEIPPEALEDETFAAMIAEGEKYLGYPYVWGGSSPETSFDCSGFVCWVLNQSGWSVGRTTAQGLYNFCTPVSAANAKPGDLIFFVGTYDTPDVSHVDIYVGGGQMLHCGNPISYANVNVPYWQAHFYCFGRLPS